MNQKTGDPKTVSEERDWGYTIGGPIGKPGGANNLFFFTQTRTGRERRAGRFGGSVCRPYWSGKAISHRRPTTPAPCSTASGMGRAACRAAPPTARGCFQDGVLGRIPRSRLYPIGQSILKLWPEPNAQGLNYNYENTAPEDKRTIQLPTARVDYQASTRLRLTARYTGQLETVKPHGRKQFRLRRHTAEYPFIYVRRRRSGSASRQRFIEGGYGYIQNQLGSPIINASSNRCSVGLWISPCCSPMPDRRSRTTTRRFSRPSSSPMFVDGDILPPRPFVRQSDRQRPAEPDLSSLPRSQPYAPTST